MLVMGGIIGVGIFFKPHGAAMLVGEPGPYFAMWALGALAALAGAMTFAELAATFPRTGGWYVFLREGFGAFPAFLFAWIVLLVISTGACAAVADFCAQQIEELLDVEDSLLRRRLIAGGIVAGLTGVALTGVRSAAVLQNLCMLAKLLAIALFVFLGLVLFQGAALQPVPATPPSEPLAARMITAALPVLFTYGGWQLVTYVAPHVRDPERNLPRAIVLGVLGVGVTYLLLNGAYVRVLGMGGVADLENVPLELAQRTLGTGGAHFLTAAMAVSALGFLVATLFATPGIYVAMAREGLFFEAVGRENPQSGAPRVALLIQGAICLAYLAFEEDVIHVLADSIVFVEWIFHALLAVALFHLRRSRPELPRPFRSPLYPLFPALYFLIASAVVIGNLVTNEWRITRLGLIVLALGMVVYGPWRRLAVRSGPGR